MKKLIFIVLFILPVILKAPPITEYSKDLRTHIEWLRQEELRKEKELNKFLFHLALRESGNDWKSINKWGYFSKYQFHTTTLETLGIYGINTKNFRKNPYIFPESQQEIAVKLLLKYNKRRLKSYYKYIGCTINNIYITESGLLAASHLVGAGRVIKFLESEGDYDYSDALGTKLTDYLNEFKNYQI